MNAEVTTTSTTVPANDMLGTKDKTLYYIKIKTGKGEAIINIGDKNFKKLETILNTKKGGAK